jgi:hypothetical protein
MGASVQIWTHFGLHCSVGPKVPVELPQTLHKIIRHSDEPLAGPTLDCFRMKATEDNSGASAIEKRFNGLN